MSLFKYLDFINEKTSSKAKAKKSHIPVFSTIKTALKSGKVGPGDLFSTKGSDRIYMVTAKPWGDGADKETAQTHNGLTAKGFSGGGDQSPTSTSIKTLKKVSKRAKERAGIEKKTKEGEHHHSRKEKEGVEEK
jgi:hypothetical protein